MACGGDGEGGGEHESADPEVVVPSALIDGALARIAAAYPAEPPSRVELAFECEIDLPPGVVHESALSESKAVLAEMRESVTIEESAPLDLITEGRRVLLPTGRAGRVMPSSPHWSGSILVQPEGSVFGPLPFGREELVAISDSGYRVVGLTRGGGEVLGGLAIMPPAPPAPEVKVEHVRPVMLVGDADAAHALDAAALSLELAAEMLSEKLAPKADEVSEEDVRALRDLEVTISDDAIIARRAASAARHGKPASYVLTPERLAVLIEYIDHDDAIAAHMAKWPEWWATPHEAMDHSGEPGREWSALCKRGDKATAALKDLARTMRGEK